MKRVGDSLTVTRRQLPALFAFSFFNLHPVHETQGTGEQGEGSGDGMKAWARSFYLSAAWEGTRAAYLMSQDYICERCGEPAKVVHHKRRITRDNINDAGITLNWDNLEALCQDCHNKEHHKRKPTLRYRFGADGELLPPIGKNI